MQTAGTDSQRDEGAGERERAGEEEREGTLSGEGVREVSLCFGGE